MLCPALWLSALVINDEPLNGLLDEMVCLCAALTFVGWRIRASGFSRAAWIVGACLLLAAIGILSSAVNGDLEAFPRMPAAVVTVFADLKMVLLGLGLAFFTTPALGDAGGRGYPRQFLNFVSVLAVLPALNIPFTLFDLLADGLNFRGEALVVRGGLVATQGVFTHKYLSGICFCVGFIASASTYVAGRRNIYLWLCLAYLVGAVSTQDVKSIASVVAFVAIVSLAWKGRGSLSFRSLAVAVVVAGAVASYSVALEQVQRFIVGSYGENVRTVVWPISLGLAWAHFPFGNGAGTFGSMASFSFGYSPTYYQTGIAVMHGGSPQEGGSFLMDFMWPKFLAEYGFIGTLAFLLVYLSMAISMYRRTVRASITGDRREQALNVYSLGLFVFFAMQSIAISITTVSYVVAPMALATCIYLVGAKAGASGLSQREVGATMMGPAAVPGGALGSNTEEFR